MHTLKDDDISVLEYKNRWRIFMDNKKRNIVITLIALLAIGFASVSSVLVINGLLAIGENSDDFKIIFTSATID